MKLRVLTADSVDTLRLQASETGAPRIWEWSLARLEEEFELKYVQSEYDFNPHQQLLLSSHGGSSRDFDAINAERMLGALPTLTPADATDERLWVTLALGHYRDYVSNRWPKDVVALGSHVLNHVFASTGRGRERNHAIARLWWSGYYVRRFAPLDLEVTLQAFFSNSDLSVQLLGRPNLATVPPVARGALNVFRKYFLDQNLTYDRGGVRSLLEGLDFLAGRRALGVLSDEEVESLVETRFREHLGLS